MKNKTAAQRHNQFMVLCSIVLAISIVIIGFSVNGIISIVKSSPENTGSSLSSDANNSPDASNNQNADSSGKDNGKPKKVATATVVNTGDILIHNPVLYGAETSGGSYDFSSLFKKASSYFKSADLAVANLEVSLGGTQSGEYKGYPAFNTPDELIDDLKNSGISLLLTANNHCYDTGLFGLKRTVQVLKEKNMPYIGTRESEDEPKYIVKDVNGIKIGMACYTYSSYNSAGRVLINGATIKTEANELINTFCYDHLNSFYSEVEQMIADMKKDGADCTVFYMHWGNEYKLQPNEYQKSMAQKLCNLGVDVIVGGHPHVIEPIEMLYAEGGEHTTVCLYSLGNSVSNQRREELTGLCTTGHTEDGMLFYYTFDKYSDGTTVLSAVDIIPLWVQKTGERYKAGYTVYPLENASFGSEKFGLTGADLADTKESFERTKAIVAEGLTECQKALGCKVRFE